MTDAIGAAETGLAFAGRWIATTASNIANAFAPEASRGGNASPPPAAAARGRGTLAYPGIDLSVEMPNLLMAADGYEANLAALARAQSAYQSVVALGRPRPEQI